ncbi:restriction endonuclease subunit S [Photobacterium leiognathi]|uniref:restriction endonuclease subunit S n=1 Tax=Photobacterium leiognathi TaxID=553611 RepID=UPI0034E96B14
MTAMSETKKAALSGKYAAYPEYKDSGVEWLGDIPTHWSAKPIKFLCTYNDEVINDSTDNNYEIEYVDIGSVSASTGITKTETICFSKAPSRARRIVKDGDVIISTVRTYLEAIAPINNPPSNMVVSTGFAVIRPTSELHKDFAAYCLRAKGFIKEVVARSVGVSYPAINASDLVNISIPFVSIDEQTQIAAFLDHETAKIDTLIEKQQQLIELLKEKRQTVISHAVTKGLNPDAPMKDSGIEWLGEVPAHWGVINMIHVLNAIGDVDHYMPQSIDKGIPYVMTGDLTEFASGINFDNCKQVSHQDYLKLSNKIRSTKGDVIMARYATIGTVSYIDIDKDFLVSYSCVTIKPNQEKVSGLYLYYYFKSHAFLEGIQSQINTNTQGNVGVNDLKKSKYRYQH